MLSAVPLKTSQSLNSSSDAGEANVTADDDAVPAASTSMDSSNNTSTRQRLPTDTDYEDMLAEDLANVSLTASAMMMKTPPWEERASTSSKSKVKPKQQQQQQQQQGRARTARTGVAIASNHSRDDSSSAVTFQTPQHQETTSLYTESNSLFISEDDTEDSPGIARLAVAGEEEQMAAQQQVLLDPSAALNFAMEHRIFLTAALNLLTERDRHAPELGMMDPIVLKSGPLKKASHLMNGVWKVKYVEIRRGMFSYYENAVSNLSKGGGDPELLLRKNIPLEASTCTCRAVKLHQKALNFSPNGAIFELDNEGGKNKRLWMATSREERQAWIQAINNAMVGGSVTRGDALVDHRGIVRTVSGRSPFKTDLRKYLKTQNAMRNAKTALDYITGLRELLHQSLQVPVKWIAKQGILSNESSSGPNNVSQSAFKEESVSLSVDQLWKDLQRDSVCINGEVYRGDSSHGPERILGALTRQILSVGRSSEASGSRSDLRESKALVYARDILLAGNRTRSGGDSYYCVSTLCSNADLVVVVPSGAEVQPVVIDISEDESDESFQTRFNDKSGWVKTRIKLQRSWRKHFFVLSEGTLSYYEGATPRPHGLKGQRVLTDANISIVKKANQDGNHSNHDQFIVTVSVKDEKDRLLLFESEDKMLDWVYALECVIKAKPSVDVAKKANRRRSTSNGEENNPNNPSSMVDVLVSAKQSTLEHALKLGMDREEVTNRIEKYSQRATSAVRVSVKACTEYKVCTIDPEGVEELDTWANVRAHFLQAFRITGGPNGRITRGEEIVRLSVIDCIEPFGTTPGAIAEGALSPSSIRGRINRRIFRRDSMGDDGDGNVTD